MSEGYRRLGKDAHRVAVAFAEGANLQGDERFLECGRAGDPAARSAGSTKGTDGPCRQLIDRRMGIAFESEGASRATAARELRYAHLNGQI